LAGRPITAASSTSQSTDFDARGSVGADRDRFVSSEVSGFLAGPSIDLSNGDPGALAGEQDCGGAADPVTGAGDEGNRPREPWHRSPPRLKIKLCSPGRAP
jgi:hypothetical protein